MMKQADITSLFNGLKGQAQDIGSSVSDWYSSQPDAVRKALLHGLVGAGAGAALAGTTAAMRKRDPDESVGSAVLSPALMGALLGGTAGAGVELGKGVLNGGIKLPGLPEPEPQPLATRLTDPVIRGAVGNWGPVAGAAAPFAFKSNRDALGQLIDNLPTYERRTINGSRHWSRMAPRTPITPLTRRSKLALGLGIPAGMLSGYLGQRALEGNY